MDQTEKLETVVALQYRVEEKDNGSKSKFEIKQNVSDRRYVVKQPSEPWIEKPGSLAEAEVISDTVERSTVGWSLK